MIQLFSSRRRWAAALGVAAVAAALVAGPALGVGSDPSEQPPPGNEGPKVTDFVPGIQPPQGAPGPTTTRVVPGLQPANPNPDSSGLPTQLAPDEPASGAKVQRDRGQKGAPVVPE